MDTDTPDHRRFRRRSIRKKGHDYTAGTYHVTICIQDRRCLLGDVVHGDMWPNDAGEMINRWWHKLPAKFPGVTLDESVVMPNHFHGIVVLAGTDAPPEHTIGEGRPHGGALRWAM